MTNDNWIYAILCPEAGPVYVGYTKFGVKTRLDTHWAGRLGRKTSLQKWMANLSVRPEVIVLEHFTGTKAMVATAREAFWIRKFRKAGFELFNVLPR